MNKLYVFLLVVILFNACRESAFEQVVKIDIPEHESRLAINTIMLSMDDSISVLVSNSLGILNDEDFSDIRTAEVTLLKDGLALNPFTYNEDFGYYVNKLPEALGNETVEYRLEVSDANYPLAVATQRMPVLPAIISVTVDRDGTLDDTGERVDEIIIEIDDQANDQAFYAIRAYLLGEVEFVEGEIFEYESEISLRSNNPLVNTSFQTDLGLLITDGSFDGTIYKLNTWTYFDLPEDQEGLSLRVELINITEDTYLYARSLSQYYDALGNPFAEPVTIHSNIEEGYGLFGLGNVSVFELELE
jgi:hypothetical protein